MDTFDLIEQGKIKRYFRATRKLDQPNFISHITQRAAGKEPLFLEKNDYLFMIGTLKEISEKYSLRVFAFCLMQNHLHMLINPKEKNLYDSMRDLFSIYAMWFNRKYERKGHLFGGPYRQAVCLDDSYLMAASLYIHLNPVRAGLESNPLRYRWSSSRLYCNNDAPKSFVNPHFILGLLSGSASERKQSYRHILEKGAGIEAKEIFEDAEAMERFKANLVSLFPSQFRAADKKKRIARASGMDLLSIDEIASQIERIKNKYFSHEPESREAKKYLIEQLISRGYKRKEIADRLGVSRKTVYNILRSSS